MAKLFKRASKKIGLPPGTLIHIGEKRTEKVKISLINYDERQFQEKGDISLDECFPFKEKPTVTWINVTGLHDIKIIEEIGKSSNIHPLLLEDILHTGQRPKMEDFDDYLFFVCIYFIYGSVVADLHSVIFCRL